jgi:hypothetical protein
MQTALIDLLKGHPVESLKAYPPLIPLLLVLVYLGLHLTLHFKHGALVLKISVIVTASIMAANYIVELITNLSIH